MPQYPLPDSYRTVLQCVVGYTMNFVFEHIGVVFVDFLCMDEHTNIPSVT